MSPITSVVLVVFASTSILFRLSKSNEEKIDEDFMNPVPHNTGCGNIRCDGGCQDCANEHDVCKKCSDDTVCTECINQYRRMTTY